jgi:hypothetical protein
MFSVVFVRPQNKDTINPHQLLMAKPYQRYPSPFLSREILSMRFYWDCHRPLPDHLKTAHKFKHERDAVE